MALALSNSTAVRKPALASASMSAEFCVQARCCQCVWCRIGNAAGAMESRPIRGPARSRDDYPAPAEESAPVESFPTPIV